MGQKVNPHGLRVGVIKDWDSRWYARNEKVGDLLVEDDKIRKYLKKTLYSCLLYTSFWRLKSMMRYFFLLPPPRWRTVMRP